MRYYKIMCHRGHCGRGKSTEIVFAFAAENLLEAMDKARRMPAVKHTKMIISGREIDAAEYNRRRELNAAYKLAWQE